MNFYFLNVDISLNMHDLNLKLHICVKSIVVEGTVSRNFDRGSGSLFRKFRKEIFKKINRKLPVFCHKTKTRT